MKYRSGIISATMHELEILRLLYLIDYRKTEEGLRFTSGSDCASYALAIDELLEYAKLYLDGNMQMWIDTEDSLELR